MPHLQHLANEDHGDVGSLAVPQDGPRHQSRLREGEDRAAVDRREQHRQQSGAAEPEDEQRDE